MNNLPSIGPWSRVLVRLDAVPTSTIVASLPKNRKRGVMSTPDNGNGVPAASSPTAGSSRPQKRIRSGGATAAASSARLLQLTQAQPSATRDPFALLPLHVLAEIVKHLNPLDVVVHQRVAKAWRVILASEYIYTLALRFHFPFSSEAREVWRLHRAGERFPEAAVAGYRAAAARYTRRPREIETVECVGTGLGRWIATDGWLVFDEGLRRRQESRIGVQKLGGGEAGRGWIVIGTNTVQDLAVGGGFLRVLLGPGGPGDSDPDAGTGSWLLRLYDLRGLSVIWEVPVPEHVDVTQNMSESHTGYIVYGRRTATEGGTMSFHLLSLATGGATTVLEGIECGPWAARSSYLTPNSEILAVGTSDNIRLFSIPSGGTLLATVPIPSPCRKPPPEDAATGPPRLHFHFSEVTRTLSIIDDHDGSNARAWRIHVRSAADVQLRETINYRSHAIDASRGGADIEARQLFGPHGDCIVLSPLRKGLEIDAVWYDGAAECARRRVHPPQEEEPDAMEMEPRRRVPGMWLEAAVRDERWVVVRGSDVATDSRVWVAVDFGAY